MDNDSDLTISRVTVLTGHTDPDTAHLVDDYPYGRTLRCQIRYWVDTRKNGDQRFVSQTTNPKREGTVWNKPKAGTYSAITVMYLNSEGHVKQYGVSLWIDGPADARVRAMGVYDALTDDQRERYDTQLLVSRRLNPTTWTEWDEKVTALADYIAEHGEAPELANNVWRIEDGRRAYLNDPAAYVAAARALLAGREGTSS